MAPPGFSPLVKDVFHPLMKALHLTKACVPGPRPEHLPFCNVGGTLSSSKLHSKAAFRSMVSWAAANGYRPQGAPEWSARSNSPWMTPRWAALMLADRLRLARSWWHKCLFAFLPRVLCLFFLSHRPNHSADFFSTVRHDCHYLK